MRHKIGATLEAMMIRFLSAVDVFEWDIGGFGPGDCVGDPDSCVALAVDSGSGPVPRIMDKTKRSVSLILPLVAIRFNVMFCGDRSLGVSPDSFIVSGLYVSHEDALPRSTSS